MPHPHPPTPPPPPHVCTSWKIVFLLLTIICVISWLKCQNIFTLSTNVWKQFTLKGDFWGKRFTHSPWNSPQQSAIGEGFAEANSVFIVITSAKILLTWSFPGKIYIQFTIFNTYFLTKLSFTNKRYHLHVLEKCLYVLQEVRSVIYFWQFIHPLSLCFTWQWNKLCFHVVYHHNGKFWDARF